MNLNYYDLLSTTVIGVVVIAVVNYLFLGNLKIDATVYLVFGSVAGYFINAIGSFFEDSYYQIIKGKPSDKLLLLKAGQNWTGCNRVKFYEANTAISRLRMELNDPQASTEKMFSCAMRKVNSCGTNRVSIFNAQFAWSRTILTTVLIADVIFIIHAISILFSCFIYDKWYSILYLLPTSVILLILSLVSFYRFREYGYYYAKEVLSEYLTQTDQEFSTPKG